MKNTINVTVGIDQFSTHILLAELYNRVYDHVYDEERKEDIFLEGLSDEDLFTLRQTLKEVKDETS